MLNCYKKLNQILFLSVFLVACNHAPTIAAEKENIIGSPKITIDQPGDKSLLCQEGWVDISYDVTDTGSIENVYVLNSEPPGVFDQYALEAFKKLTPTILSKKPAGLKGVTHRFNYPVSDKCSNNQ